MFDKLKSTLDSATPNTAEILNYTSESTILNTETSKMSPESDTTIPTTPIKTLLYHHLHHCITILTLLHIPLKLMLESINTPLKLLHLILKFLKGFLTNH